MPNFASSSFPSPTEWADFERGMQLLFQCILNDPLTQRNGRGGQNQNGVDIFGRRDRQNGHWVGVQCKGKNQSLGRQLTKQEILDEVKKARAFKPPLKEYFIATTAPDDVKLQQLAREITDANAKTDHPFDVAFWGWETICSYIVQYPDAIRAFHPDASPFSDELNYKLDRLVSGDTQGHTATITEFRSVAHELITARGSFDSSPYDSAASIDKTLHAEIDNYRDLVRAQKPATALDMLNKLKDRIWQTASNRLKFRLLSNIAAAELDLGRTEEGAKNLLAALPYDPDDPNGQAHAALAYFILGDRKTAVRTASEALEENPTNLQAVIQLLQAASDDETVTSPWDLIPKVSHNLPETLLAVSIFYRRRSDTKWIDIARESNVKFPNNVELGRAAAEAEIEHALRFPGVMFGERTDVAIDYSALKQACDRLLQIWSKLVTTEVATIDVSLPHNLAQGFRLLGNDDQAAEILDTAITRLGDDPDLIRTRAVVLVHQNRFKDAERLLEKLPDDTEARLFHAELVMRREPATVRKCLTQITDNFQIDSRFRCQAKQLIARSYLEEGNPSAAIEQLTALRSFYGNNPEILINLADAQAAAQDSAVDETLTSALTHLTASTNMFVRFRLAEALFDHEQYEKTVSILENTIDTSRDSPPLRLYLAALINGGFRAQSRQLLESLESNLKQLPYYLRALSVIHAIRGDLPSAIEAIELYLEQVSHDLSVRIEWIHLLMRCNRCNEIDLFLKSDLQEMRGTPSEEMQLALILAHFGNLEKALYFGYRVLLTAPDDPVLHLRYMGLLFSSNEANTNWLQPNVIAPNTIFLAENARGDRRSFLIEPDEDLRKQDIAVAPDHAFAKAANGLKKGATFPITRGHGHTDNWTIINISHKYIAAHHQSADAIEYKFPEFTGFERFNFDENADKPFAEIEKRTKELHDSRQKLLDYVAEKNIPLETLACTNCDDIVSIWQALLESGHGFKVCEGNVHEREIALQAIKANKSRGCIIDRLTAHIIRRLGVEDVVAAVCGRIGVTQTTIDFFRDRQRQVEEIRNGRSGSLGWRNDRLVFHQFTEEDRTKLLQLMESDLSWLTSTCETLVAEPNRELSERLRGINSLLGCGFADPILAADRANRILIVEDLAYRRLANQEFQIPSTWLQPILMIAVNTGILSHDRYCEAIVQLADAGHKFTSIDTNTLIYASNQLAKGKSPYYKSTFAQLGGANADIQSHRRVALSFLRHIWKVPRPELVRQAHTGELLRCLLSGRTSDWPQILEAFERVSPSIGYGFITYLREWRRGHFLMNVPNTAVDTA